jgi:hypothetical protein
MSPRRVVPAPPWAGTVSGNIASKKPIASCVLGKCGDTRVSPKPAIAPPLGFVTWSSMKLGEPGSSNLALSQLTPNTTGV